jgi:hypothetical protein
VADEPLPSEEMTVALVTGLIRKGLIDEADVEQMCAGLSEDAAHQLRCCLVEASAPRESDWRAERARGQFRVVDK